MSYDVYNMAAVDSETLSTEIDAFICFDTMEDRSFYALHNLYVRHRLSDALILTFDSENSRKQKSGIKDPRFSAITVDVDKNLSASIIPCLRRIDEYIKGKRCVGIDISSMPIPHIAQILHFIIRRHENTQLAIYYTEPSHYHLDNLFDYSSFGGEIDIKTVPGFEGETSQMNEVKRVLFYLLGFESAYLSKLIPQDVNPTSIAPINGFPSFFPKYKDISLINSGINFIEEGVEIFYSEANNPFEMYNTLVMLKDKYIDSRIDIIPVGTKPMALGACLFALKTNDARCRIIFPFPSEYNPNKSTGCGKLWEYKV